MESEPENTDETMVEVDLGRVVIHDGADRQYIYLTERDGERGFPIVIGNNEAGEIQRVVAGVEPERPLTHQLCYAAIRSMGAHLRHVDIVELKHNTFYARIILQDGEGRPCSTVDARPSDAIALALRARCGIRVAETVFQRACTDPSG